MIIGCYTLDLYCDSCEVPRGETVPAVFTAESGSKCREKARKAGWKLDLTSETALCPKCAEERRKESSREASKRYVDANPEKIVNINREYCSGNALRIANGRKERPNRKETDP